MKRTPLIRKTPLRRSKLRLAVHNLVGLFSKPKKKSRYKRRERAPEDWWRFVKSQPCMVLVLKPYMNAMGVDVACAVTRCTGVIEADHAGRRGIGRKCPDSEVISLCTGHHRERTDFSGTFRTFKQGDMRRFLSTAVSCMHNRARRLGVAIPNC